MQSWLTKDRWHKICMCQFMQINCWSSLYFPYQPWTHTLFQVPNVVHKLTDLVHIAESILFRKIYFTMNKEFKSKNCYLRWRIILFGIIFTHFWTRGLCSFPLFTDDRKNCGHSFWKVTKGPSCNWTEFLKAFHAFWTKLLQSPLLQHTEKPLVCPIL